MTVSAGSITCWSSSWSPGKHFCSPVHYTTQAMGETEEQLGAEVPGRGLGGPEHGALSRGVGCMALPVLGCVHPHGSSPKPVLLGFSWKLPHTAMINS